MGRKSVFLMVLAAGGAWAQGDLKQRPATEVAGDSVEVKAGTHILLQMKNAVSTRQAQVGDRLYLETAYPVFEGGHLVVPQGSWVMGTVTAVRHPGHLADRNKGALTVRFDSLTLTNGVSRDFHSDLGAAEGSGTERVDKEKSTVNSAGKGGDVARTVQTTAEGAALGSVIGATTGHLGEGAAVGAAGGLATGLVGVLVSRGPDASLPRGSTVEMVLDRPLSYKLSELPAAK